MSTTASDQNKGAAGPATAGPVVPCVTEGGTGRRHLFQGGKLILGTGEGAGFQIKGLAGQIQIAGPSKSPDQYYLFLTKEMTGRMVKGGQAVAIEDPSQMGLQSSGGRFALPVTRDMKVDLRIGEAVLRFSWEMDTPQNTPKAAPKSSPQAAPQPPAGKGKIPVIRRKKDDDKKKKRGKIRLTSKPIKWIDIPVTDPGNTPMWGSFIIVATGLIALLFTLGYMRKHYLPPKDIAAPPPKFITKLLIPEKPPEPIKPPEQKLELKQDLPVDEEPEKPTSEKPDEAPNAEVSQQRRAAAREQVKSQGLLAIIGSAGGAGAGRDITRVTSSLQNAFSGLGAVTTTSKGDTEIKNLGGYGEAGGIDDAIAGLKAVKTNVGRTQAEKVEDSVVSGEAAGDQRRSMGAIYATMKRYLPLLKSKHKRLLRTAPAAAGKMLIEFVIKADGSVASPNIKSSAFGKYPEFEKEILDVMLKIRFEAIEKGDVKVQFPFVFTVDG